MVEPLASYVDGWRERTQQAARDVAVWRRSVEDRVPSVVSMLVRDFAVTRVTLFGSFSRGEAAPGSDLDLLVEGLAMERLIDATVRAERILREVRVDLVPADRARPWVAERARTDGSVLYG
ncbi:MAG: nucleotidyltransferase domain-containing protein [Chromatiaceae bacterium]